jgi:integrase
MDSSTQAISPLRQRMLEDMRMRKLSPQTQRAYIRAVRQFAAYLRRSPDTASVEDLRRYQLHLVDHGVSPISLNAAITGLKFFFDVTMDRGELMAKMHPVRVAHRLPVVLSREEVARLIAAAGNLKHQTALSVAYGTGLRASEVITLELDDIDWRAGELIVRGKGRRHDRLPIPIDVGKALVEYLRRDRPRCTSRRVCGPSSAFRAAGLVPPTSLHVIRVSRSNNSFKRNASGLRDSASRSRAMKGTEARTKFMLPAIGSIITQAISLPCNAKASSSSPRLLYSSTIVCCTTSGGTPALVGLPNVARPEPAFTSSASAWPW